MTVLYLHIGLHKTGTSFLQRTLANNRPWLEERGFFYPPTGPFDAHHYLVDGIMNNYALKEARAEIFRSKVNEWFSYALERSLDVIVSSEMLSEPIDRVLLKKVFAEVPVKVVIYLRRQDLILESVYNQIFKQRGETFYDITNPAIYETNYWYWLNKWLDFVEKDETRLMVRLYDEQWKSDSGLLDDFFDVLGVQSLEDLDVPKNLINNSIGIRAFWLLEEVAEFSDDIQPHVESLRTRIDRVIGANDHPMIGNYLSYEKRKTLLARVDENNEKIRKKFFPTRTSLFDGLSNAPPDQIARTSWAAVIAHELER